MSLHQNIMDKAYDRWNTSANMTQDEFWSQLSQVEKVAVYIGNLNYQVKNGGFNQWVFNQYSECADELCDLLDSKINTVSSLRVANLIRNVVDREEESNYECELCFYGCDCEEDECWCECECGDAYYDDLDDKYYKLQDQFLKDVKAWLQENVK